MEEITSKVYVLPDEHERIIRIDGGYTTPADLTGWVFVDKGTGDRYNLCQHHYLPKPLRDARRICRYKLVDGAVVERTQEEMDADYVPTVQAHTAEDRIAELEAQNAMLTECILELSELMYN